MGNLKEIVIGELVEYLQVVLFLGVFVVVGYGTSLLLTDEWLQQACILIFSLAGLLSLHKRLSPEFVDEIVEGE